MLHITLGQDKILRQPDETVLDTLLKANFQIPYGCRQGLCHACMMRSLDTPPPASAQAGLKDTLKNQNCFLACLCHPEQDMTVALPNQSQFSVEAQVVQMQRLTPEIARLVLEYQGEFNFYAGQFVNLKRFDGLTRCYSIANRPRADKRIEFHIRRLPDGKFSDWIYNGLKLNDTFTLSEAQGSCYYIPERTDQPMMLIGTGCGLAPLYGILTDALEQGHTGPVHLYHGSRNRDGLYFVDEMIGLSEKFNNFYYTPCLSGDDIDIEHAKGRAHDVALSAFGSLKDWRVFLCGHPEMVNRAKMTAYLKGAALRDIYADAFYVDTSPHQ